METVEVIIELSKEDYEYIKEAIQKEEYALSKFYYTIANGTPLPENHGKIVDLGKIDEDRIEQDNPIITINIDGMAIEAVSLDYLDSLPDLTKKEE